MERLERRAKGLEGQFEPEIIDAAVEFLALRDRLTHPDGRFDKQGRFYLDPDNQCPHCAYVRSPSAKWPYSELIHGRTAKHVAARQSLDVKLVKRAAHKIENPS